MQGNRDYGVLAITMRMTTTPALVAGPVVLRTLFMHRNRAARRRLAPHRRGCGPRPAGNSASVGERDPDQLADELEREADDLEEQSEELCEKVDDARPTGNANAPIRPCQEPCRPTPKSAEAVTVRTGSPSDPAVSGLVFVSSVHPERREEVMDAKAT